MAKNLAAIALILVCFLAFDGVRAVSAASTPTPVPEMKVDFSSFNFQLGTWHCVGHIVGRSGERTETDVNTMTLDGHWMSTHSESPSFDPYRKKAEAGDSYLGYDSDNHVWIGMSIDNFGTYGYATSPGWVGNTLTFTGYVMKGGKFVEMGTVTTTKVSDTEIRDVAMELQKNGTMKNSFSDRCTKAGAM